MDGRFTEIRRGWRILLASAFGVCFGMSGLTIFSFGVFIVPLTEAFGWTRGEVSRASSFLIVGNAVTAPFVGALIDRYGARRIAIASMTALAIGYGVLSRIGPHLALFYAVWLALAFAGGGTSNVVWTRAVNMTFDRTRGMALGLILAGSGTAAIFAPMLCTKVILAGGWRMGYAALAGAILLLPVTALALWFRDPAGRAGLARNAEAPGLTLREALRRRAYWTLALAFFLVSLSVSFIIIHLVPLLIDRGMTPMGAASVAGLFGVAIVIGRLSDGPLVDLFHGPTIGALLFTVAGASCLLLAGEGHAAAAAVVAVIGFGLAGGAEVHLLAFLTSRYFGMRDYGKIYGCQLTTFYIAAALGPLLGGLMYDSLHAYTSVLACAAALFLGSAGLLLTLGRYPRFGADAASVPP